MRLARWLYHQQERYTRGTLAVEDKQRLEAIGMDWNSSNAWEDHFRQAKAFYVQHGHLQVPARIVTADGMWLNKWLAAQRKAYSDGKLTRQQIDRLESIGMKWEPMKTVQWNRMYDALISYCEKGGSIAALPQDYKSEHGDNLFNWLKKQKHKQKHGFLEEWQLIKLRTLTEQSQI